MTNRTIQLALLAAALAFGAQAPTTTTPRALIERGALAEEHQRDFAGAEKLYAQAEASAKAAGDTKTAQEAAAARERVLARQGKAAPGQGDRDAAVREQLRERAVQILSRAESEMPSLENLVRSAQALADLGPSVVDLLAQFLHDTASQAQAIRAPHLAEIAARALAEMGLAAADQELSKAYESTDPTFRKAVITAARAPRFAELQLRGAEDPIASVRAIASRHLFASSDPRAALHFAQLARAGDPAAREWLTRTAPEHCVEIGADAKLPLKVRSETLRELSHRSDTPPSLLPRVLALAARSAEPELRSTAWAVIRGAKQPSEEDCAKLLAEAEPLLVSVVQPGEDLHALRALSMWRSTRFPEALRAALSRRSSDASADDQSTLAYHLSTLVSTSLEPAGFETVVAVALATPPGWNNVPVQGHPTRIPARTFHDLAQSGDNVPLAKWTALWPQVPAHHRSAYASGFGARLENLMRNGARPELPRDATPILRHLLENECGDATATAVRAIGALGRLELLDDVLRTTLASARGSRAGCVAELYALDSATVLPHVRAHLIERVKSPRFAEGEKDPLWVLSWLPAAARLQLWRELWERAEPGARNELLRFIVQKDLGPARAELLVELYPQIERIEPDLRSHALLHFGASLIEAALPILERELRNPAADVRSAAMSVAEQFRKHREAVAEFEAWRKAVTVEQTTIADLSKLLESSNRDVVLGAVKALGILRARPALPTLVKLLERKDPELQAAVRAAIDAIGAG